LAQKTVTTNGLMKAGVRALNLTARIIHVLRKPMRN